MEEVLDFFVNIEFTPFEMISFILALLSFVFAIVERLARKRQEINEKMKVWGDIDKIRVIMEWMERLNKQAEEFIAGENIKDGNIVHVIAFSHKAHALSAAILRDKFAHAISLENRFTIKTAEKWNKLGKISSKWQMSVVLNFIDTKNIDEKYANCLDDDFSRWHQLENRSFLLSNPDQNTNNILYKNDISKEEGSFNALTDIKDIVDRMERDGRNLLAEVDNLDASMREYNDELASYRKWAQDFSQNKLGRA